MTTGFARFARAHVHRRQA